ncbi:MAG: hypothetical protein AAF363_12165 [Bacteroidota bacterium]
MPKIVVSFDVLNSSDIINNKKGRLVGWLASRTKSRESLKTIVEQQVTDEVVRGIKSNLNRAFQEEGIVARLNIEVEGTEREF